MRLVSDRFVWRGMKNDIKTWCAQCADCQAAKITRHVKAPVMVFPPAARRFGSLHIDLVGPLPPSEGHRYLLTIVERFSRWPEALSLRYILAASCIQAFVRGWLPHFGVPDKVITDRGAQFTGSSWNDLLSRLVSRLSTPHPTIPRRMGWWKGCTATSNPP